MIVPCFNEEEVIEHTHKRLISTLDEGKVNYEIVYVDDGSTDRTPALLKNIQSQNSRVRLVRLSRNFGHQIAITAGLDYVTGDAVVLIDADLQDPPEVIPKMLEKWKEGFQVVYGQRLSREGETAFKLQTAHLFYRLINRLSDIPIPFDSGDFRLIDRSVVDTLRRMHEKHRFLRAMTGWVGFRQTAVPYERAARFAGLSKYPLRKMLGLALDGIVSFSTVPLRMVTITGFAFFCVSVLGMLYALFMRLLTNNWVPGWTLIFMAIMLTGGLQFIFLGIIGEYIGRIYNEAKDRPLFVVQETLGFPSDGKKS